MSQTMIALLVLQQAAAPRGSYLPFVIQMVAIIAIMYFLIFRPQSQARKRHKAMLAALKRGDDVMTDGGIIGEIVHIKDDRLTVRTAESTRIVVARPKIARLFAPTTGATSETTGS